MGHIDISLQYANRSNEHSQLAAYLKEGVKGIVLDAYPASGVTSFVKAKISDDNLIEYNELFYVDIRCVDSLEKGIVGEIINNGHKDDLQKIVNADLGSNENSVAASLLECIAPLAPMVGGVLKVANDLVNGKSAIPVYTGCFSSALSESIVKYFSKCNGSMIVAIDRIECLSEVSFEFLHELLHCDNVQCILIRTENTTQYTKIENYLHNHSINLKHISFDKPCTKLIKELGSLEGIDLSDARAQEILDLNKSNIHEICRSIRSSNDNEVAPLDAWEKAVIYILNAWCCPINTEDLSNVIERYSLYTENKEASVLTALGNLEYKGIIEKYNGKWKIKAHYDPLVCATLEEVPDCLLSKEIVYRYLCSHDCKVTNATLRYNLSKELGHATPEDARPLFRNSLLLGSDINSDVVYDSRLDISKKDDCLLAGIYYCKKRNYLEALKWINGIQPAERTRYILAFRAVLLDRTRSLNEAERELRKSLKQCEAPNQKNLLGAFLISTYIHMERLSDAKEVYNYLKEGYSTAPMHGYLIRNAISAFSDYKGEMYDKALIAFEKDKDDFGYYTTLCNKGYALCKYGRPKDALKVLKEAERGFNSFSNSDRHVIYNDLGVCYFMLNCEDEALKYLELAYTLGSDAMPRIFALINIACVYAINGNSVTGLEKLDMIKDEVCSHPLDRVRQKYYLNRLMIEYLHGNKNLAPLLAEATKYPDRYMATQSRKAINVYKRFSESHKPPDGNNWRELYSPCGLAYWYLDPLKLLPEGVI